MKASRIVLAPLVLTAACSLNQFRGPAQVQVPVETCAEKALIDDCEDADDQILPRQGRDGFFYTFADKAGSTVSPSETAFQMAAGGPKGSTHAVRLKGQVANGAEVYVGAGLEFKQSGTYDASTFKGVAFSAKAQAGAQTHVRFMVADVNTDPKGKVCTACNNDFGVAFKPTDEWVRYEVPFADLKQETGWGAPRPPAVDTARLTGLKWQVSAPGAKIDLWLDDVAFIGCPQ
jgi:hypothetical protein